MKKNMHAVLQVIIALTALTSVILEISLQQGPHTGLNLLSYFTIQSNLIVALAMALNARFRSNPPAWLAVVKSSATIWILVTGLVFHFLLSQVYHPEGILRISNIMLHYIVPAGMAVNWIVFEKKGMFRHRDTFIWIGYPVLFAVASLLRAQVDGFYPYWFLNPTKNFPEGAGSLMNVILIIAGLAVVFSIIGNIIVLADRFLQKIESRELQEKTLR